MFNRTFLKVGILGIALFMVIGGIGFFNSMDFKKSINDFFGFDVKVYTWCPNHTVDFQWKNEAIPEKWKKASPSEIQAKFCQVSMEPIRNVDLAKLTFKPLLKAQSATAQTALLEWNSEAHVFRAQGLPFYSSSLSRELVDK
ncbi:MAG: hypothetical protein H7328_09525 [Bdellovibrio sp.]|nr:hypothetical protein [Bdellovibrio sp.]